MGVHFSPKDKVETSATDGSLKLGRLRAGVFFCTQADSESHAALWVKIQLLNGINGVVQTPDDISIRLAKSVTDTPAELQKTLLELHNLISNEPTEAEKTEKSVLISIIATIEKLTNTQFTPVLNAPEEEEEAASSFRP